MEHFLILDPFSPHLVLFFFLFPDLQMELFAQTEDFMRNRSSVLLLVCLRWIQYLYSTC